MITKPTHLSASIVSASIINEINKLLSSVDSILTTGVPAEGVNPAIAATDIKSALGESLEKVESVIAAYK